MSTKPHYFAIGVFVIAAAALGLAGLVMLSSDALRAPERFVETYVDESVQGIDVGTPFKLRGVKVGSVSRIAMVSSVYDTSRMYVLVRIALDQDALKVEERSFQEQVDKQIRRGLRLRLIPQGITGLSYVEADLFPDSTVEPLEIDWEPEYTYIPSMPATMTLLSRTLERVAEQLNTLDIESIGLDVKNITSNLSVTVVHLEEFMANAAEVSEDVAGNVRSASQDLPTITSSLTQTTEMLDDIINSSDQDIDQILLNLRYITDDTRELIRMLKRYPGMLLSEPPEKNLSR